MASSSLEYQLKKCIGFREQNDQWARSSSVIMDCEAIC